MNDHASRDHAHWSASATARHVACHGSLTLEALVPEGPESIHAARGTAAHTVAEKCLTDGGDAIEHLGLVVKTKKHSIEIDEELANSAQAFIDYVRGRVAEYEKETGDKAVLMIEQKFSLADINPPFEAGGTGDAVMYFRLWKLLEIADLKNGQGYVSEKENPQLRTYGLGAMLANYGLDVERVRSTIVQPRIAGGKPVREETIHVADLVEWTADLLADMRLAKQAEVEFAAAGTNSVLFDEWVSKWLKPGNCKFCKREGDCPALRRDAQAVANVWFDDMDQPRIGNMPGEMSPEQMAKTLDLLPMLEDWAKAVRALAHSMAEQGVEIPGYQLSEKIGNRKYEDEDLTRKALVDKDRDAIRVALLRKGHDPKTVKAAAEDLAVKLDAAGLDEDTVFSDPKLKSPAQLEKVLGAKRKALIEPFVVREVTGTNLVSTSKTTRPPAKSVAEKYFEN